MFIAEQLHFDVARTDQTPFDVDGRIAKCRAGFRTGGRQSPREIVSCLYRAHSLAAATRDCLDEQWVPYLFRRSTQLAVRGRRRKRLIAARHRRDAGALRGCARGGLASHETDHLREGPDEREARV